MAIVNCKECAKDLSDQALTCPHCGAPTGNVAQQKPSNGLGVAAMGCALGAIFTPYFASVFFTPAAFVLGLVAFSKRQKLAGGFAVFLAVMAAFGIVETSNKISDSQQQLERSARELQQLGKDLQSGK